MSELNELGPYKRNNIYCGECADMMSKMPNDCVDLTVTSPPYDDLRDYKGFVLDWRAVLKQLYRITKPGGVVVWIAGDQTINGSETGTSFRQALYAKDECDFLLHDTMIYEKSGFPFPEFTRYNPVFEYMFVFSKGRPVTFNPINDRKNLYAGAKIARFSSDRQKDGSIVPNSAWFTDKNKRTKKFGVRNNIWRYKSGGGNIGDKLCHEHPAAFPENLARDHIISWSNPGDLVLDPFMGSGTTAKMAMQSGRDYLGFDISQEYVDLAIRRVSVANPPLLVLT